MLPGALQIGISYAELMSLTPRVLRVCGDAYVAKQEETYKRVNFEAWLHGLYSTEAICAALSKRTKYPDKPHSIGEKKPPSMFELRDKIKVRVDQLNSMRESAKKGDEGRERRDD